MAVKYVPYFKDTISGQAILDNFTRTKRILKYADNDKVNEKINYILVKKYKKYCGQFTWQRKGDRI